MCFRCLIALIALLLALSAYGEDDSKEQEAFFADMVSDYLRTSGLAYGDLHSIHFTFSFPNQGIAKRVQLEQSWKGFVSSIVHLGAPGDRWGVMTTIKFPLTPETLRSRQEEMIALAAKHGGEYSGFGLSEIHIPSAQSHPPKMTMHRTQAGTLDESGWASASSSHGSFTVSMPCEFNDYTVEDTNAASRTRNTFAVGCLRSDLRKFSATRIQYRDTSDAQSFFEKNASAATWPGTTVVRSMLQGLATVDVALDDGTKCGFLRFVHAPPDNMVMIVEAPKAACDGLDNMSRRFFESLVVGAR